MPERQLKAIWRRLILSGDFDQLRPVTQSNATDQHLYCFASPMWASCVDVSVLFDENYRQHETDLIDMLNDFRTSGFLSLRSQHYIKTFLSRSLNCCPLETVRLHSHKESVIQENDECLALLPGNFLLICIDILKLRYLRILVAYQYRVNNRRLQ